jgi:UDP:flavonoid glycosyltransferase YjiC (YdhE family)
MGGRLQQWTQEVLAACDGVEVIAGGIGGMVVGVSVAEKLGVPFIEAHLQPVGLTTSDFPGVLTPWAPALPGAWRLSHQISNLALFTPFEMAMAKVRTRQLGLPARLPRRRGPVLYGFSSYVLPPLPQRDRRRIVTGYWSPQEPAWRPPAALERFLDTATPVVSVGFGSMPGAEVASERVLTAIRRAGAKAVVLRGWGGLSEREASDDVYFAAALPHAWLFPRMSAVVHHGGAGATGASLAAGAPTLVIPFGMDQPFWGARVAALGAGPPPIPRWRLNEDRLERALADLLSNAGMHTTARELGAKIAAEDGVRQAVAAFEEIASSSQA